MDVHGPNRETYKPVALGGALLVCVSLFLAFSLASTTGTPHPTHGLGPAFSAAESTRSNGEAAGEQSGINWLTEWNGSRPFGRAARTLQSHSLVMGLLTSPAASPPPVNWAIPGTVIENLDAAAGSPYGPAEKTVALTFDDGPSPIYTPQVLAVLTASHVSASFEIVGEYGALFPTILRQEVADGMSLVSHTWSHVDLNTLPAAALPVQLDQTDLLLQNVTGHPVRCLRPPGGHTDASVSAELGQRGLAELYWDTDPSDYLKPPAGVIAQRVLSALHPGAIIVLHDGGGDRSQTVAALPSIISGIRADGYQIVPVCGG